MRNTTYTELAETVGSGVDGVSVEHPKNVFQNMSSTEGQHMKWDQIAETGGMLFDPEKRSMPHPLFVDHAIGAIQAIEHEDLASRAYHLSKMDEYKKTPAFATLRSDNLDFLGVVGETYTPIPHSKGFQIIDEVIKGKEGAHYREAGVINGGAGVWGVADMNLPIHIEGTEDRTDLGLLFSTSHDASSKFHLRVITNRIWCGNTLALELSKEARNSFAITHTKNYENRLDEARVIAASFIKKASEYNEWANVLSRKAIPSTKVLNEILLDIFKVKQAEESEKTKVSAKTFLSIDAITALFQDADGGLAAKTHGTAWNLFNAVTRYIDHEKSPRITKRRKELGMTKARARAESAAFGTGDKFKQTAVNVMNDWLQDLPRQVI